MRGTTGETWTKVCAEAAVEQNPDKLLELVRDINRMLQEKETRLKRQKGNDSRQQ
jgi:hypothetical protein